MTPKVPTRERGTATLGMTCRGQVPQEEEDDEDHQGDGEHQLELHVPDRCTDGRGPVGQHRDLHSGRQGASELGQQRLDAVHDLDDVGAGLPLNVEDHGGRLVHPGRLLHVLRIVDGIGDIGELDGRPVPVGDDQRPILAARKELIVGADDVGLAGAVKAAFGLIDVRRDDGGANIFEGQAVCGKGRRVSMNAHGRPLSAADADEPHARQLGDLLGEPRVGEVFYLGEGERFEVRARVRMGASAGFTLL